jgi:hypothetical protein
MRASLLVSVDVIEFRTFEAYSSLGEYSIIIIIIIILVSFSRGTLLHGVNNNNNNNNNNRLHVRYKLPSPEA